MLKAVFDTNVLISAFISKGSARDIFRAVLRGEVVLITSEDLLIEFRDVLCREKFGFTTQQVDRMVDIVRKAAIIVKPGHKIRVITQDPEDNFVLECAYSGGVEYVVSGDKHLLDLRKYRNIRIISVKEFKKLLKI